MYSYFSDLHVQILSTGLLEPGEQLTGKTVTRYMPWWAFGFINKTYLTLATNQRLILIEHKLAWFHAAMKLHSVESIPWSNVEETRVKGIFVKKIKLRAKTGHGPLSLTMRIPNAFFGLLAPMKNNMQGARDVASAFQQTRQLGAKQMPATLPAMQQQMPAALPAAQFGAPQAYGPPPSQPPFSQQLPYSQQPAQPAINAQGYNSVPPPAAPPQLAQTRQSTQPSQPAYVPPGTPPRPYSQS